MIDNRRFTRRFFASVGLGLGGLAPTWAGAGTTKAQQGTSVMSDGVRRVITGETPEGKSFLVRDERLGSTAIAGIQLFPIWGVGEIPVSLPTDGVSMPGAAQGRGQVRTAIGVIPPRTLVGGADEGHLEFDEQGFHKTDSVDVAVVMSGEVTMRVPGSPDLRLGPGEVIVQNGALHAWENETDEPAKILWVWIKGDRKAAGA